jgi:hypothetical protein
MSRPTRVFVIYATVGYDDARLHYNRSVMGPNGKRIPRTFLSNDALTEKLRTTCPDVEFIPRTVDRSPVGYQRLLAEIKELKDDCDGLVIVGGTRVDGYGITGEAKYPLAFAGLPTIIVGNLLNLEPTPYRTCIQRGAKIAVASLDREGILPAETSEGMFQDLLDKIRILDALRRLRQAKILFIKDPAQDIDIVDYKVVAPNYNDTIVARIKETFGTEFVFRDVEELISGFHSVTDDEARGLADTWMSEAVSVQENLEGEVLQSARLYLAIERMKNEMDVTPAAIMVSQEYRAIEEGITTTTSLPMMEFQKQGIIGCYQSYTGTTLAQLLGYFMAGRLSFVHDDVVDIYNGLTLHMHCGCPINDLWGEGNLPYKIRDYTTGAWHEDLKRRDGAVPAEVEFPVGVPVTIWKVLPMFRKITVYTGTSVDGAALYDQWEDIICRNKLPVKVDDAERILLNRDLHEYGCHRAATFGDLRKQIKQLATFIGYEVEEWDR